MFGSTKRKLNVPMGFAYGSYDANKVTYSSSTLTQDPLGQILRSPSHMMECGVSHHMCVGVKVSGILVTYFQVALSIEEIFSCVVGQHKGIHARSKGGNVDMAHQCQLTEV